MNTYAHFIARFIALIVSLVPINASAQHLRSIMVNACNGGGSEGENEYVILQNDTQALPIYSANIQLRYGNTFPASTTYADTFLPAGNAGYVNALNTYLNGSCDFAFINGQVGDTIQANAYFIIMYQHPTDTINFYAWCANGIGNVYVLFSQDPSWGSNGNFVNAPTTNRYIRTTIRGQTNDHHYANGWSTNADGNYVVWQDTGAAYQYANYSNCTPGNIYSLPIALLFFEMESRGNTLSLHWATASEVNNAGFHIQRSIDGLAWQTIAFIEGSGNTSTRQNYHYEAADQEFLYKYYRLEQVDFNGDRLYSPVVERPFSENAPTITWDSKTQTFCILSAEDPYEIFAVNSIGKVETISVQRTNEAQCVALNTLPNGLYYLVFQGHNTQFIRKIYIIDSP